ncbi:MAG: glycosyltransferase [Planctomycetes bacterium]|nr:glycosyltransferase [Planctomycetota bacterium]
MHPASARPALAFDASEWFHDPAWARHVPARHWRRLPARWPQALAAAAAACARHGVRATFFVDGLAATRWPAALRQLVDAGHEVASAGWQPVDVANVAAAGRDGLAADLVRARAALEAATGLQVLGFRAPWPAGGESWWRGMLAAAGHRYELTATGHVVALDRPDEAGGGDGVRRAQVATAWELDSAQPRLRGLPAPLQRVHYGRLVGAAARLDALLRGGGTPIAERLGLSPAAAAAAAPVPSLHPAAAVQPATPSTLRLAVVVPLKDEAEGVPSLLAELDALTADLAGCAALEFVFVDDGSTDATASLLAEAAAVRPRARLVRHDRNRGVAAAIRTGLLATDAPFAASIDADLSYDPRELAPMLRLLDAADVVTASPYHPRGGVRNVPGWRLVLSRTLSWCYRRLLRRDLRTWTACFRVYRREAVVDLPQQYPGFLGTAELLVRLLRRGGRVVEHPCVLEARLFGVSKLRVLRTVRDHLGLLWQVARGRIS